MRNHHAPDSRRRCRRLLTLLAFLAAGLTPAAAVRAQAVAGDPVDLRFEVRDATTGQPAVAERIVVDYIAGRLNTILDTNPTAPAFTAAGVPIKDIGQYVITAWYRGVPYWWQKRGADLMAGPVALDVFGTSEARETVTVTGLNVVVRHRETTAEIELLCEVTNDSRPQATVLLPGSTFELQLPAGATGIEATYRRGPEPTPVAVTVNGTRVSLAMPLTPGANSLRLTARAPWDGTLELPVGSDLPLAAWSLLVAPATVTVEAAGLQAPDESSAPGFVRRAGPALGAGESLVVRLVSGAQPGAPQELFQEPAPAAAVGDGPGGPAADGKGKGGVPVPLAVLAVLIIIGGLILLRRGRS